MRILFIFSLLVLPLTACKTTYEDDDYKVTVEDDRHYGGYKHCPPGHAKKGWC